MPLGKMSFKSKEDTFKNYIPYIKKLLNKYDKKKGIIHTNSFELANWIQKSIKDTRLVFHNFFSTRCLHVAGFFAGLKLKAT